MGGLSHTVSGDIASFRTPSKVQIESLKFHFLPKQEGSGDPSPSNVRPITGWTGLNGRRAGKNIGHIVGYSAASMSSPTASRLLTNAYGTTINTRDFASPDTPLVITQEQTSSWDPTVPHSYKNGYFCVGFDNLIFDKSYDFSFKITNVLSDPLNVGINSIKLNPPGGGQKPYSELVNGNILIFKNIKWVQYTSAPDRCTLEFRNCGMSFTISEIMVTPANKSDGVFEPYSGAAFPVTFPKDDENKFNATVKNGNIASDGKEIAVSTDRLITNSFIYLPAGMYTLSSQQNYPCAIYVYSDQDEASYVNLESLVTWHNSPVVFTLTKGRYIRIKWKNNDDTRISPSDLTNIQIKLCTFYSGGYFDPIAGEIVCSWRKFKVKDYEWVYRPGNNRFQTQLASNEKANAASSGWTNFAISDSYKASNYAGYANLMIASYGNNNIYIRDDTYEDVDDFVEAMGEVEIAYELANPIHIPIPAQDMKAFLDHNNFWSDANDITEVTYPITESKDILATRKKAMVFDHAHHKKVKWNQLVPISSINNSLVRGQSNGSIVVQGTTDKTDFIILTSKTQYFNEITGHKYFLCGNPITNGDAQMLTTTHYRNATLDAGYGTVYESERDSDTVRLQMRLVAGTYDFTIVPVFIDLTVMFGAGKEPSTVNEVKHICEINGIDLTTYQPYDEGSDRWLIVP